MLEFPTLISWKNIVGWLFILAFCLSACWVSPLRGQLSPFAADSPYLEALPLLHGLHEPEAQVEQLLLKAEEVYAKNRREAYRWANWARQLADQQQIELAEAKAVYWCAQAQYEDLVWNEQLRWIKSALLEELDYFAADNQIRWRTRFLSLLSTLSYLLEEDRLAWQYNEEVLHLLRKDEDQLEPRVIGDTYRTRANLFFIENRQDSMSHCSSLAMAYYQRINPPDSSRMALVMMNQGIVARLQQNYQESDLSFARAQQTCPSWDTILRAEIQLEWAHNIAARARELPYDSTSSKMQLFNRSNELLWASQKLDTVMQSRVYYQLGANHQNMALAVQDDHLNTYYKELKTAAHQFYHECIRAARIENNLRVLDNLDESAIKLASMSEMGENRALAEAINAAYLDIYNDMLNIGATKLQLQKAEAELFQQKEKQRRSRLLWLFAILLIIMIAGFLLYYQSRRHKELQHRFDIRMEALRSQMNSHFISNTLNAIDALIMEGKRSEASSYVVEFSRLCRNILNSSKRAFIGLDEEINILRGYLKFEKLRLGERLNIKWELEPTIDLSMHQVPALILQPFVENAIWHGILSKKDRQQGTVRIAVQHLDEMNLRCTVEDDGVGRKQAKALRQEQAIEWQSWGMKITNERIEALKGVKDASIEFEDLYALSGEAAGTRVVITLPKYLNVEV